MKQNREPANRLTYSQVVFDKGAKAILCIERIIFSINGASTTVYPHENKQKKKSIHNPYVFSQKLIQNGS